jgi:methionyl-tRNA synthetase
MLPTPRASRIVRRSMSKPFFITTAIDYTNGAPHIGHAYEKVLADVLARYHRLKGDAENPQEVFYLTGVDQHGQKVQQSAEKAGLEPQAYVDGITQKFTALWEKLDVKYSAWAATTDPLHKECVRANLQKLWDDKDPATGESRWIYKKTQRGFYSVRQEQFLTDKERGPDGQFGPEWGVVEERDEENFYFRLTQAPAAPGQAPATGLPGCDPKQWLLDFIDKRSADGKPFVVPDFRVAELRNAVEKLEGDLCISRPASRLKWGIPFPESFGEGFVTYVWFDALVNYITYAPGHDPHYSERTAKQRSGEEGSGATSPAADAANNEPASSLRSFAPSRFNDFWPPLHVIGKDILIPAHGVYWPIMLKALGFTDEEMPTLLVHGWWNIAGAKMSKSLGNIVDPDLLADKYGPEALRYYLMSDIATGRDADFSEERLVTSYNSALANNLGNLLNRTLNMAEKFRPITAPRNLNINVDVVELETTSSTGTPETHLLPAGTAFHLTKLKSVVRQNKDEYASWLDRYQCQAALDCVSEIAQTCNETIQATAPWELAKSAKVGNPKSEKELSAVLYHLAESLRIIAILIWPVLPDAAHGIFDQLAWKLDEAGKDTRFRLADAVWGGLPDGHVLGKPVPLFPRIEAPAVEAK